MMSLVSGSSGATKSGSPAMLAKSNRKGLLDGTSASRMLSPRVWMYWNWISRGFAAICSLTKRSASASARA